MKRAKRHVISKERRATVLAGIIILQGLCALFFIGDVITDLSEGEHLDDLHLALESIAAFALVGGVVFLMIELRRVLARMTDMDTGLKVAQGQIAEVMDGFFDAWRLTDAERDVAVMLLKGLDNDEIARVRQTASGTVRAQTANIYSKSDTHSRAEFISLFMEELMSGDFSRSVPDPFEGSGY
ncbi:helix-turn-helix transcriptional regulator [uncultured Sulfitobacter sp.]|uniref:helix-turn-helix transcriptional regulator n=1 Tax=uncultured Sulfitobacter sp. TaxID=191468 RepID=UPI002639C4A1|nr:helix-turn-helix transcriptional regulator [uncultured Sulfitobacter sp.]